MPKFRRKPELIEADQWFPGKAVPGVLVASGGSGEPRYYVITAHDQPVYLEPGDWVRAEPDGRGHYPIKPDIFERSYDPVE